MKIPIGLVALLVGAQLLAPAMAGEAAGQAAKGRYDIWLGVSSWPALGDIRPAATGSFDTAGLGIGGSAHWPVTRFAGSDLLLGVDGFVVANDSNLRGFAGEVLARQLYLGGSLKWAIGDRRNVYLDAGVGYHELDMAELSEYIFGPEREVWGSSTAGAFIGASWDIGAGRPGKTSGLTLGLKVHVVDFGSVHDENPVLPPLLGAAAGSLGGPIYIFHIGYGGR